MRALVCLILLGLVLLSLPRAGHTHVGRIPVVVEAADADGEDQDAVGAATFNEVGVWYRGWFVSLLSCIAVLGVIISMGLARKNLTLREQILAAEEAYLVQNRYTISMSFELRSILIMILGNANLIKRDGAAIDLDVRIGKVIDFGDRMMDMVNNLDVTRE